MILLRFALQTPFEYLKRRTISLRMELVAMKAAVEQLRREYAFSQRRACGLLAIAVSSCRYVARVSDEPLRTKLVELAREKPRFGYRRLHVLLRRCGENVNHKRVHRIYRAAGLTIRRKKRKHCVRAGQPLRACTTANQEWALDFVHDAMAAGRTIRVLSIVDGFWSWGLVFPGSGRRVTRVLDEIIRQRGLPRRSCGKVGNAVSVFQAGAARVFSIAQSFE